MWWRVDEGPVEAGGLGVEGQHQLVLTEKGLGVCLWIGLPLRQRDNPSSAESVSPDQTNIEFLATVKMLRQNRFILSVGACYINNNNCYILFISTSELRQITMVYISHHDFNLLNQSADGHSTTKTI